MRVVERRWEYTNYGEELALYPLFDIHLGCKQCKEDKLRQVIDEIKNTPNAFWIFGGDGCEFINRHGDPRHKEFDLAKWLWGIDDTAKAQEERLKEYLLPIAPQCLAILCGNHEGSILQATDRNMYASLISFIKDEGHIKEPLGLGYRGFIRIRCVRGQGKQTHTTTLTIFAEHGWSAGRQSGGVINNAERVFGQVETDMYIFGHSHASFVKPHISLRPVGNKAIEANKLIVNAGSFRGLADRDEADPGGYEDRKGLPPLQVGGVKIYFQPDYRKLTAMTYTY